MSRFEVDSARVGQASAAVQQSVVALGEEADRLMRHLVELQGSWQGQAAASFQGVVSDWRSTHERVRQTLESIQQALAHAGRQYADVEAANVRLFAG